MLQGTVKWFSAKRGFGFLLRDNQPDLFVHFSGIVAEGYKTLREGDKVEYEVSKDGEKEQAVNVKVLEKARRRSQKRE